MDFDANALLVSMLVGTVGMGIAMYGKRQARVPHLAVGFLLMAYPYFVSNVFVMLGIAVALVGALWIAVWQGL